MARARARRCSSCRSARRQGRSRRPRPPLRTQQNAAGPSREGPREVSR
jgi:hypothetical protein